MRVHHRIGLAMFGLALLFAGCSKEGPEGKKPGGPGGPGGRGPQALPVEIEVVQNRDVEYTVKAVGSVEAFEVVQVTARVPGAVEAVHFREGTRVGLGQVLVEIEPERYSLVVEEARAALEKARATLAESEAGLARREGVNEQNTGLIPGEEVDGWRTRVRTGRAEITAREAALKLAERNADDAKARAPFAGVVQTRDVQTGRYVQPGALLATLVRREPLLLRFQVPEGEAARLVTGRLARFTVQEGGGGYTATIVHVAESADASTRMVAVTAEVRAPHGNLRPGSFAEVTVPVGEKRPAPVIAETAVRPSEKGFLAYVIQGGLARERVLELGMRTLDGKVEVKSGLEAGDSLVVRGAEALRADAMVRVSAAGPAAAGDTSATPGKNRP
jgi:multidrug efflux system membrane fusion protein